MGIDWDALVLAPCESVFGQPALYMPATGNPYPITVIFDEGNKDLVLNGLGEVNSAAPIMGVRDAQFQTPPRQGDRVRLDSSGDIYIIKDTDPDGHGSIRLKLNYVGSG